MEKNSKATLESPVPMRRAEFIETDFAEIEAFLAAMSFGFLATRSADTHGKAERLTRSSSPARWISNGV